MVRIFTALGKGALCTAELLDEFFNYHKSYARARQGLYGGGGYFIKPKHSPDNNELQSFYSLLNKLKNQGMLAKSESPKGALWRATAAGFNKCMLLKEKKVFYVTESDDKLKIIAYDIPEKERIKRLWLCEALEIMNFKKLQKSLAVGKSKIPEIFLEDLHRKKMLQYVHIFEVSQTGTIKELP